MVSWADQCRGPLGQITDTEWPASRKVVASARDSAVKRNRKVLDNDEDPEPGPLRSTSYWRFSGSTVAIQVAPRSHIPMEAGSRRTRAENCATLQRELRNTTKIISDNRSRSLAGHW